MSIPRLLIARQERERIARALHDSIFQGMQALILHCHAAARQLPGGHPATDDIARALQLADQIIAEGRDQVMELRHAGPEGKSLEDALVEAFLQEGQQASLALRVAISGRPRGLARAAQCEAYFLLLEAMRNARSHSGGSAVELLVSYANDRLIAVVRDDGRGLSSRVSASGTPSLHWGLIGMHERAWLLGAKLSITGPEGAGTTVRLEIPARLIYRPTRMTSLHGTVLRRVRDWLRPISVAGSSR